MKLLKDLLDELPQELERQVFTHASWSERSSDSYTRLAFLGDSVLALAVTTHLYPRLEAERFGAGRLTKIRAQAVSGSSCRAVAERLQVGAARDARASRRDDRLRGHRRARSTARPHVRGGRAARRPAARPGQWAQQEARRAAGRQRGLGEPRQVSAPCI